jgi:hypothetical protein
LKKKLLSVEALFLGLVFAHASKHEYHLKIQNASAQIAKSHERANFGPSRMDIFAKEIDFDPSHAIKNAPPNERVNFGSSRTDDPAKQIDFDPSLKITKTWFEGERDPAAADDFSSHPTTDTQSQETVNSRPSHPEGNAPPNQAALSSPDSAEFARWNDCDPSVQTASFNVPPDDSLCEGSRSTKTQTINSFNVPPEESTCEVSRSTKRRKSRTLPRETRISLPSPMSCSKCPISRDSCNISPSGTTKTNLQPWRPNYKPSASDDGIVSEGGDLSLSDEPLKRLAPNATPNSTEPSASLAPNSAQISTEPSISLAPNGTEPSQFGSEADSNPATFEKQNFTMQYRTIISAARSFDPQLFSILERTSVREG